VERVTATRNTIDGINVGKGSLITDCIATNNDSGIRAAGGCTVRSSVATENIATGFFVGQGSVVSHCAAFDNGGIGIRTGSSSTIQNCSANANRGSGIFGGDNVTIVDCVAAQNGVYGIIALNSAIVQRCTVSANRGEAGISLERRSQVLDCVVDENGTTGEGKGIQGRERTVVKRCSITGNQLHGIDVLGESIIIDNRASENGRGAAAAGIRVGGSGSRIESNQTRDNNGTGILAGAGDVIIRNTSGNNTAANFVPASGPNFGPIQSPAAATSPTANHVF
jgi:hypothetical protein